MQNQYVSSDFRCPNCKATVYEGQNECENCKTPLAWETKMQTVETGYYENEPKKMSAFEGYKTFLKTISSMFAGRSRRKEYWGTVLFHFLLLLPGVFFAALLMVSQAFLFIYMIYLYLVAIYMMIAMMPLWALSVRRLHDIGKSGWWLLVGLVPLVGWIFTLIWSLRDSDKSANQYGESPKYCNRG